MLYPNLKKFVKKKIIISWNNNEGGFDKKEVEAEVNGPLATFKDEGEYKITHIKTGCNLADYGASRNLKVVKENIIKLLKSNIDWNFGLDNIPTDLILKIKDALR